MRIPKPYYKIDPETVEWVYNLDNPKKAIAIWKKRYEYLLDAMVESGHMRRLDRIGDLWQENYERLVALIYPKLIEDTEERRFFLNSPRGSIISNKPINGYKRFYYGGDKYFIGD